jgi:hypothetical protein
MPYCGEKKASQISVNRKAAHLQRLACLSITGSMHSTPTAALEVILMLPPLYIEGEARQATYRLNCFVEFTRPRFNHSEVFEKMTIEWPSFLAPADNSQFFPKSTKSNIYTYFWKPNSTRNMLKLLH